MTWQCMNILGLSSKSDVSQNSCINNMWNETQNDYGNNDNDYKNKNKLQLTSSP